MEQPAEQQPEATPDKIGLICIDMDETLLDGHSHNRITRAILLSRIMKSIGKTCIDWKDWNTVKALISEATQKGALPEEVRWQEWEELFDLLRENNKWQRIEDDKKLQWELVKDFPPIGVDEESEEDLDEKLEEKSKKEAWRSLFETLVEENYAIAIVSFSKYGKDIIPRYLNEVIGLDLEFIGKHICIISDPPKDTTSKNEYISRAQVETKTTYLLREKICLCDNDPELIKAARNAGYRVITAYSDGTHIDRMLQMSKDMKSEKPEKNTFGTPYSSPSALSSAATLRSSPSRVPTIKQSKSDCALQSNYQQHNIRLRKSFDGVRIK